MTINQILAALAARDHSRLPLASDVRYTENGQTLEVGDGLWGTLTQYAGAPGDAGGPDAEPGTAGTRAPSYRIDFADAAAGEAVYCGGSLETTTPGLLMLRTKSRGNKISEIEAVCVRAEKPGERGGTVTLFQPSLLTQFDASSFAEIDAELLRVVSPGDARSRPVLSAIVDRYFDALVRGDSRGVEFAAACRRRDNGVQATGDIDAPPLDRDVPAYRPFALGCAEQIDSGFFKRISRVRGRRHIAADEARGLLLSVALFDQPGDVADIEVPGMGRVALPAGLRPEDLADSEGAAQFYVKRYEPNFRVPMTELTIQLTKIENGRISRIESVSRGAPFGLSHGWA